MKRAACTLYDHSLAQACVWPKGNRVNIREPGHGDRPVFGLVKRGNANELGDIYASPGKSSLFFLRDGLHGIGSTGDMDVVPAKRHGSCGVRCARIGP